MELSKDIFELAESGDKKVKEVPVNQVAYCVHKSSYDQIVFQSGKPPFEEKELCQ